MNTTEQAFAKAFPFWFSLAEPDRQMLVQHTTHRNVTKGTLLHGGGQECTGAILVQSGCVRTYLLSEEGREITLYRLQPNAVCMLSASCVLRAITFDVFVDAETDCDCLIVNGNTFSALAERNLLVKNYALETAVTRFSKVMWVLQQILFMRLDQRLAIFLWEEYKRTGQMTIRMTHEQIAKNIGSAREAVSRMLKYFVTEGIVRLSRSDVELTDCAKLQQLAEKQTSSALTPV